MMRQLASLRKKSRKQKRKLNLGGREERFRFRMSERKVEQEMQPLDRREKAAYNYQD